MNSKDRWSLFLGDSTAESGSDAGSAFGLYPHNDAGTIQAAALSGSRATGLLTVKADPTANLGIATKQYVDAKPAGAVISDTPPASPTQGQTWWRSSDGRFFIWYNDGNSSQWVEITAVLAEGGTALDKNMIVNGAIQISQEIAFGAPQGGNVYVADQWVTGVNGPTVATHYYAYGFGPGDNDKGIVAIIGQATAYTSVAAGNYASIVQYIEGNVLNDLQWGTANAIPAVLAFDVYSDVAGTFVAAMRSGTADRSIVFPIVIGAGEVGTYKRFNFAVPAITSGTFPKTTAKAAELRFTVMAGTNWQAPSSGAWLNGDYIGLTGQSNIFATASKGISFGNIGLYPDPSGTGVAPRFRVPDYATELVKCKRYWHSVSTITTYMFNSATSSRYHVIYLPVTMRVVPTGSVTISEGSLTTSAGTDRFNVAITGATAANQINITGGTFSARM
jgi:hypothetical protein